MLKYEGTCSLLSASQDEDGSTVCKGMASVRVDDVSLSDFRSLHKSRRFAVLEIIAVVQGEWMFANVADGKIIVKPADVDDALAEVLGLSYRY